MLLLLYRLVTGRFSACLALVKQGVGLKVRIRPKILRVHRV